VTALTLATETLVPSAVGIAFLGDTVREGFIAVAFAGLLLALSGAVLLARFGEVDLTRSDAGSRDPRRDGGDDRADIPSGR
jgi:hypothetical protein